MKSVKKLLNPGKMMLVMTIMMTILMIMMTMLLLTVSSIFGLHEMLLVTYNCTIFTAFDCQGNSKWKTYSAKNRFYTTNKIFPLLLGFVVSNINTTVGSLCRLA